MCCGLDNSNVCSKPGGGSIESSALSVPDGVTEAERPSVKSVSESELCEVPSSVAKPIDPISDPEQVVGVIMPACLNTEKSPLKPVCPLGVPGSVSEIRFPHPASQHGEDGICELRCLSIGGNDGGADGGIEDGTGACGAGEAGKGWLCKDGIETGVGGKMDVHSDSGTGGDFGEDCAGVANASQGGGTEACSESVTAEATCIGGGGMPDSASAWSCCKSRWRISTLSASMHLCRVGGKTGGCVGGAGTLGTLEAMCCSAYTICSEVRAEKPYTF